MFRSDLLNVKLVHHHILLYVGDIDILVLNPKVKASGHFDLSILGESSEILCAWYIEILLHMQSTLLIVLRSHRNCVVKCVIKQSSGRIGKRKMKTWSKKG